MITSFLVRFNFFLGMLRATASGMNRPVQFFKYFLILDFEATCDKNRKITPTEIIEFPVIKMDSESLIFERIFHYYVQPKVHADLTDFCTELTGITQDMVDGQPCLEDVLKKFDDFLRDEQLLLPENNFAFVTCGDWDLKKMLPSQCQYLNIPLPSYFGQWINIKQIYCDVMGTFPRGLTDMARGLRLPMQGRLHSGIDDCRNIASVLCALIRLGAIPRITGTLNG
ncbi:ERI1 exoribonuclease 3 [Fasciola hepatica]|uniref:ERI1 exoribonuclease 3 n=1 Tax=Fasciola hepatica TaxID=6192 RepID=A0A4E0RY44_FASHE|nr:ERI1 exoribonuclease 3 [Fasciola hepatica]